MIRTFSINHLIAFYIIGCLIPNKFVTSQSQCLPCDPIDDGVNPELFASVSANAEANPDSCLCTSPCTEDKVAEFVRFYYLKRGMTQYHKLDVTNPLSSPLFNYRHSLKFLIHGYIEKGTSGWMPPTGKQLVKDFCGYVILVDFGAISNCSFERTFAEIDPSVAKYVTNVIRNFNFNPRKIEFIGHSIGAHIAGSIGANLNNALQRITGLDPGRARYDETNTGLNKTCAQFVQVLHTNAGQLGTSLQRGDADFYANNRSEFQPGCPIKQCGHAKAIYYYFASLFSQFKFIGTSCGQTDCMNSLETSRFGEFNDGKSGQFCFQTTPCFPYATSIEVHCDSEKHSSKKTRKCSKNCKSKSSKSVQIKVSV